ncbi:RNA polymerase-associated protein LEO1-like [Argopecten irradians]|uniref:RNA polymerase-associated protein LEO1-like n=1 Tax=Argopecten irradians TaxID=31199 RepID=UPI00371B222F
MAVTSLNGTEQTISAFVQDIIRYARQKVEESEAEADINKMEEGSDGSGDLTTSGHLCNGDATEEEIQNKGLSSTPANNDVVTDQSHEEVKAVDDSTQPECPNSVTEDQLIEAEAEVEQIIAPRAEIDVTDLDDPEIIESQDQKDPLPSETIPITTNNENDEEVMVVHPNGHTQTVVDYVNDIIEAARKRASEETAEDLNNTSKKGKKKKKSGDAGSRRGSSRTGAVRVLISRLFRRDDNDHNSESSNGNSQTDKPEQDSTAMDKAPLKKTKSNKRHSFKNILFQKKQKYQVSTEALATDDNSREKIKKRQKVSRANSFGKSLRNILSCSSSVTTV